MSRTTRHFKQKKSGMFPNTYAMKCFEPDEVTGYRVVPVGKITLKVTNGTHKYSVISSGLVDYKTEQDVIKDYMDILVKLTRDSSNPRGPNRSYRKNRENQFRMSNHEAIHKIKKFGELADYFEKGPKSAARDWY